MNRNRDTSITHISVRSLVEFILRSGDIDNRVGGMKDTEAMRLGSRLHRKIQAGMGDLYQAEVPLSMDFPCSVGTVGTAADQNVPFPVPAPVPDAIPDSIKTGAKVGEPVSETAEDILPVEGEAEDDRTEPAEEKDTFIIRLEGRADGIVPPTQEESALIDEIKGIIRPVEYLEEPVPVHLAQARCYAYMYAAAQKLDRIRVRMTYANLEMYVGKGHGAGSQLRFFHYEYAFEELEEWFFSVLDAYKKWAVFERRWEKIRTQSIKETDFPYPYREGQQALMRDVYRTILREKQLFIQAPTGVGKTLSCVFPSVKAMGEGQAERIFYLTAKTITRMAAQDAFNLLRSRGLHLKTIVLTAKEKICPLKEMACDPDHCIYARGHFDRVNNAVFALINTRDSFDREDIMAAAKQYCVCPFELSLDISSWMDAVIGDYNYAFHPRAKLKRFFGEGVKGAYIFLVDEAHNLVDRGRDMYSAALVKEDILALHRLVKGKHPRLARALKKVNASMLALKREMEEEQPFQIRDDVGDLPVKLLELYGALELLLKDDPEEGEYFSRFDSGVHQTGEKGKKGKTVGEEDIQIHEKAPEDIRCAALDLYFDLGSFLDTLELVDENYVVYTQVMPGGRFALRLLCVNPAANLQKCFEKGRASVLFSATLLPIDYYKGMLGTPESYAVYAKSCFDPRNLRVLTGTDISTRYTRRDGRSFSGIAEYILRMVSARRGNYMVFFSSYKMLEDTESYFRLICPAETQVVCQTQGMDEAEREAFLQMFKGVPAADCHDTENMEAAGSGGGITLTEIIRPQNENRETKEENAKERESLVGFCVMGSIFGEGIDLRGESLIGAIIVGPGLPMVCTEQEILRSWFDRRGQDGFRLAYQCPGMNKVLQAAGRVIRTEEDKGAVLLLDERFSQSAYRQMFPREWGDSPRCRLGSVTQLLEDFWGEEG